MSMDDEIVLGEAEFSGRLGALGRDFENAVAVPGALRGLELPPTGGRRREPQKMLAGAMAVLCAAFLVGGALALAGSGRGMRTSRVAVAASPSPTAPYTVVGPTD